MPWAAPRHCPYGHPAFTGPRCPQCASAAKARADERRPSARERGYDSKWEKESKAFLKINSACVKCGEPATLVDHVIAHRGDQRLFWNRSNWSPMCAPCHGRKTVRQDGGFGKRRPAN